MLKPALLCLSHHPPGVGGKARQTPSGDAYRATARLIRSCDQSARTDSSTIVKGISANAQLLKRVFEIVLEPCPNCRGELKIIAAVLAACDRQDPHPLRTTGSGATARRGRRADAARHLMSGPTLRSVGSAPRPGPRRLAASFASRERSLRPDGLGGPTYEPADGPWRPGSPPLIGPLSAPAIAPEASSAGPGLAIGHEAGRLKLLSPRIRVWAISWRQHAPASGSLKTSPASADRQRSPPARIRLPLGARSTTASASYQRSAI